MVYVLTIFYPLDEKFWRKFKIYQTKNYFLSKKNAEKRIMALKNP